MQIEQLVFFRDELEKLASAPGSQIWGPLQYIAGRGTTTGRYKKHMRMAGTRNRSRSLPTSEAPVPGRTAHPGDLRYVRHHEGRGSLDASAPLGTRSAQSSARVFQKGFGKI